GKGPDDNGEQPVQRLAFRRRLARSLIAGMTRGKDMRRPVQACALAALAMATSLIGGGAIAQKPGGTLRIQHFDSPPSMSIHEEVTVSTNVPMMGVFNNLVLYDQHVPRSSLQSIVPELATEWSWGEDGRVLTFKLRQGVKWHDGKPFTANDVKCTWELVLGRTDVKFRTNPRKAWYQNVEAVTVDADDIASFHLKRPQPAL